MPTDYQRARRYVLAALGIDRTPRTAEVLCEEAKGRHELVLIRRALQHTSDAGLVTSVDVTSLCESEPLVLWQLTEAGIVHADQKRREAQARRERRLARERTSSTW